MTKSPWVYFGHYDLEFDYCTEWFDGLGDKAPKLLANSYELFADVLYKDKLALISRYGANGREFNYLKADGSLLTDFWYTMVDFWYWRREVLNLAQITVRVDDEVNPFRVITLYGKITKHKALPYPTYAHEAIAKKLKYYQQNSKKLHAQIKSLRSKISNLTYITQNQVDADSYRIELDDTNRRFDRLRHLYEDESLDCCKLNNYNIYDEFTELSEMYIFDEEVQSKVAYPGNFEYYSKTFMLYSK